MPRPPRLPPDTLRLFARIDRFTCECPRCGQIIRAHFDAPISQVRRKLAQRVRESRNHGGQRLTYNPLTSRLRCPSCKRVFGVGLLLYPVHERAQARQPYDTQPTYRQLAALRQQGGGFLLSRPIKGRDSVNVVTQGICRCLFGRVDPICPVHGWEEQIGPVPDHEPADDEPETP